MIISDTSCMIDVFTIALLRAEFGQVWAEHTVDGKSWDHFCACAVGAFSQVFPSNRGEKPDIGWSDTILW